jgi:hypothetical protein
VNNKTETAGKGIGFFGLLAIAFIVLKLTGVIGWSWAWVLAPLWMPAAVGVIASFIFVLVIVYKRGGKAE